MNLDEHDAVNEVMKEFNQSHENRTDITKFSRGITQWLSEEKRSSRYHHDERKELHLISDFHLVKYITLSSYLYATSA